MSDGTLVIDGEAARVAFDCRDGADCIVEDRRRQTIAHFKRHEIPFETAALAERFLADALDFRAACAAA